MASAVEEVLAAWRECERLLEVIPPVDADREAVVLAVDELRALYADLTTEASGATQATLAILDQRVEASYATIRRVRARLDPRDAPPDAPRAEATALRGDPEPA